MVVQLSAARAVGGFSQQIGRVGLGLLSDEEVQLAWRLQGAGYSARYDLRIGGAPPNTGGATDAVLAPVTTLLAGHFHRADAPSARRARGGLARAAATAGCGGAAGARAPAAQQHPLAALPLAPGVCRGLCAWRPGGGRLALRLYCWRGATRNFGDELNTLLWPRLLPAFFDDDPAALFLGIGSVLDTRHAQDAVKLVAGAGYGGYQPLPELDARWVVHWVRGPRTARLLGLAGRTWSGRSGDAAA